MGRKTQSNLLGGILQLRPISQHTETVQTMTEISCSFTEMQYLNKNVYTFHLHFKIEEKH